MKEMTPDFRDKIIDAFDYATCYMDPEEWMNSTESTTEAPNTIIEIISILLLRLEKDGYIIPFSEKLPNFETEYRYNSAGEGMTMDVETPVLSVAKKVILEKCGWVFPEKYNYIPADACSSMWYGEYAEGPDKFWSTDSREMPMEIIKLFISVVESTCSELPERDEAIEELTHEDIEPTEDEILRFQFEHSDNYFTALCFYNPTWHEICLKYADYAGKTMDADSDLSARFDKLKEKIDLFEICTGFGEYEFLKLENGMRVTVNCNFAWSDPYDGSSLFYMNPLMNIPLHYILKAPELKEEIDKFAECLEKAINNN